MGYLKHGNFDGIYSTDEPLESGANWPTGHGHIRLPHEDGDFGVLFLFGRD